MKSQKNLLCHQPFEPLLSPNKVTSLNYRTMPSSSASQTVSSAHQDLSDKRDSSSSPLSLCPDSLLPPHLSIFLSGLLQTSPPTFDYGSCIRTCKRQDLFSIKTERSSPQEVQKPKIFIKKDLDKFMGERTLVVSKKGKMEREVWNSERKPYTKGQPCLALQLIKVYMEHLLRPKQYSGPRRQQGIRETKIPAFLEVQALTTSRSY